MIIPIIFLIFIISLLWSLWSLRGILKNSKIAESVKEKLLQGRVVFQKEEKLN